MFSRSGKDLCLQLPSSNLYDRLMSSNSNEAMFIEDSSKQNILSQSDIVFPGQVPHSLYPVSPIAIVYSLVSRYSKPILYNEKSSIIIKEAFIVNCPLIFFTVSPSSNE